jgi:glycosyltransferase involved in cell wall biosynthesis
MNVSPTVSVVLPTYNRARTLRRAIESVLNQKYRDFELIIIDDRSTDQTFEVIGKYADHDMVRVISQLKQGCSAARNAGICASRGRYIAFQDSDDEWSLDMLEKAVAALESSGPEVGVFYSDMLLIQEDGSNSYWQSPEVERGKLINEDTLDFQVCCIGIISAVIKRECFDKVGLFDESLPRFIDLELFIRLSDFFDFIHCREPLARYYAGNGISTDQEAQVVARRYLIDKYQKRLEKNKHHLAAQYLRLSIALQQERIDLLTAQLSDKQAEIDKITRSLGWRLLRWYGRRIKYPYLLPVYRLLRLDTSRSNKRTDQ